MDIKPIKNERDYEAALRRVDVLWDSPTGSAGSDEMDLLATLIEAYEREHYPVDIAEAGVGLEKKRRREILGEEN
jgi:HTH-type transcriptional regulator / antitoxin HigA